MEERSQYLAFTVGEDEYGVPILKVREIVAFEGGTRVPSTPPWIRGVLNLRGQVLPVVDLGVKFGLAPTTVTTRTCVVVLEIPVGEEPTAVGALVDTVNQVLELAPGDIEPPPSFGTQIRVEYLAGATASNGRFTLLLDTDRVLSADEIVALTEATAAADEPAAGAPE